MLEGDDFLTVMMNDDDADVFDVPDGRLMMASDDDGWSSDAKVRTFELVVVRPSSHAVSD